MRGEVDEDVAIEVCAGCCTGDGDDCVKGGDGFTHPPFSADKSNFNSHKTWSGRVSTSLATRSRK